MMNWKWNMPLQVTFRIYSSQDIFQVTTLQCLMFTTGNCPWPKTCTVTPAAAECLALLAASERVPELLLLHTASSSLHQSEPEVRESGCKSPTWTDIGKSHGLGAKPYKAKSLAVCYRTEICWDVCKLRKTCLPPCPWLMFPHPTPEMPTADRRAHGLLQGWTSLRLPREGMAPWWGWSMSVGHKAGFKISLWPPYFTTITVSMHIF